MKCLLGLSCFALSTTLVLAEKPLTLDKCLLEAAENNPDLAAASAAVQKAKYDYLASFSDMLPQVSANAKSTRAHSSGSTVGEDATSDHASYGISASQSLFTGGKNRAAADQASANLQSAEADLLEARATLSYNVKNAFAQLLYAQEQVVLAQSIAKRRHDNLDFIRLRYEGGRENKGALLLIEASARDSDFGLAEAGRKLRVAQRQMASTLGRDNPVPIQVIGKLEAVSPSGEADFEALSVKTPTHRKAIAQLRAARASLASAKSQYYPELSANASASKTGENWMPDQDEWFLGLTLTYPFFPGGKSIMNVHSAKALIMQYEQNLKATDAQLALTLEEVWADYENAVEKTDVQLGFLKAQEIRAEIARSQYASGLFSFEDWDRIENDLISAQKDDLSGRRDAVIAEANWEKIQGKSRLPEN